MNHDKWINKLNDIFAHKLSFLIVKTTLGSSTITLKSVKYIGDVMNMNSFWFIESKYGMLLINGVSKFCFQTPYILGFSIKEYWEDILGNFIWINQNFSVIF